DGAQRLLSLGRLCDDESACGREVGDEGVRTRLLNLFDDGPASFAEPRLGRQLLLSAGLLAREAAQPRPTCLLPAAPLPPCPPRLHPRPLRPPGRRARRRSRTARSGRNQWWACPAKAPSPLSFGGGIASAGPSRAPACGTAALS